MDLINSGERIRQARELRKMTQTELAKEVNVDQSFVAQVESGYRPAPDAFIEAVAFKTRFPPSFFRQESPPEFPLGSLLFRAKKSLKARDKLQIHRYGQLSLEYAEHFFSKIKSPPFRLPQVSGKVREAVAMTRNALGLSPDTPVKNLIRAVEKAGVLVFGLPTDIDEVDAFSVWAGNESNRAIIVICGEKPGDRIRMSVAHEVAHLVMHQTIKGSLEEIEKEADRFAAELLLPELAMQQMILPPVTLTRLAQLKPQWGTSIQALIRRAYDLEIITERQYHYLFEQLGMNGWKKKEPIDIPVEKPRALIEMAEVFYGGNIDHKKVAANLNATSPFVSELMRCYAGKNSSALSPAKFAPKILEFQKGKR